MEVWVSWWEYAHEGETEFSLWATEEDALQHACTSIKEIIDSDWDMDDPTQLQYAEEIDLLYANKKYRDILTKMEDYQANYNADYAQYWAVYSEQVQSGDGSPVTTPVIGVSYQAPKPGATCRGPCKNYSPDAYADKVDGTYVCRQCKIFQGIFSP